MKPLTPPFLGIRNLVFLKDSATAVKFGYRILI